MPSPRSLATWACALLAALGALAPAAVAAPAQRWTIVELPALGPRGAVPLAINNRGDVVGYSAAIPPGSTWPYYHAALWQNGTVVDLGQQFNQGVSQSLAGAVNDQGVVAINAPDGVYTWKDGTYTYLGFSGTASDINRSGEIVGSYGFGGETRAYIYSNGMRQDLGSLGGYSTATAINDKGVVVGTALQADGTARGFVWDNGTFTLIGTLGGAGSNAYDINSHGVVIGTSQDASGAWRPYILDKSGMRALANVPAVAWVTAINDRGTIIGEYANAGNQGTTSFLWEDGVMTALETIPEVRAAGWGSLFAMGINDRGWIVGWGWKAGAPSDARAFLLMPR